MERVWTDDPVLVGQLYRFFKEHADKVCNGEGTLTLTPQCLQVLHESFERILSQLDNGAVNAVNGSLPMSLNEFAGYRELSFMYDIVRVASSLKILQNGGTLHGPVSIAAFSSLNSLEIQRLPLQYIHGLETQRTMLSSLTCLACLTCLQELFAQCGADKADDASWLKLGEIHLPHNGLTELDSSLHLAPGLRVVDLSHNRLSKTSKFLQCLISLEMLNLSYNILKEVPVISTLARNSLTSLDLSNNFLSSLRGLEVFVALCLLDVRNNLLSSHQTLNCLRYLSHLQQLWLCGNPLSRLKDHQKLTIVNLHVAVVQEIKIDGKPLSYCDRKFYGQEHKPPITVTVETDLQAPASIQGTSTLTCQGASTPLCNSFDNSSSSVSQRRCRVRLVNIHDASHDMAVRESGDARWLLVSTEQLYGMPANSGDHAKPSRHHHRSQFPPVLTSSVAPPTTQCEVAFPGNRIFSPSPTDEVQRKTDYLVDVHETVADEAASCSHELPEENVLSRDDQISCKPSSQLMQQFCDADTSVTASDCLNMVITRDANLGSDCEIAENADDVENVIDHGSYMENGGADAVPLEPIRAEKLASFEQVHTACMAYDPVSCESRYLNVAAKSLLIISCGGQFPILEELPLRALRSAKQMCDVYEPMSSETAAEWAPVISLTFDTSVTQNRERAFVMYDDADLKKLLDLLAPHLQSQCTMLQCMKCGERFDEADVQIKIKSALGATDVPEGYKKETLVEVPFCPHCESEMILEVPSQPAGKTLDSSASGKPPRTVNQSTGGNQTLSFSLSRSQEGLVAASDVGGRHKSDADVDSVSERVGNFTVWFNDFMRFDQQLHLLIDLHVFTDSDEQLLLLLKSSVVRDINGRSEAMVCLMILSTSSLYIARITNMDGFSSENFKQCVTVVHRQPVTSPLHVEQGFKGQTVTLTLPTAETCGKFCFLVGSAARSKRFMADLADIIASHLFPITTAGSVDTCEGINSAVERLHREFSHDIRPPCKILCYAVTAGYSRVKNDATCWHNEVVGVLVTFTHVSVLVESSLTSVDPSNQTPACEILEKETFWKVAHMDVRSTFPWQMTIDFEDTTDNSRQQWTFTLETRSSVRCFVAAMRKAFRKLWTIELEVNCPPGSDVL